jgi:ABC-type xylose transport system permease subunit
MLSFGIGSMIYSTLNVGCNYLWTNTYGFFPPIPFGGFIIPIISVPAIYVTIWYMIPKSARKEREIKRRFVIFLVAGVYDILVSLVYAFISLLFILIPSDYQPILGFICPLFTEILLKIFDFITYRADGGRHVKMGKYFLNTAFGSGSNITIPYEMKNLNFS